MASESFSSLASAVDDFRTARRKAALEQVMARLRRRSADLLSYDDVRDKLRAIEQRGQSLQEIPLDAIIGSVGRYSDFTRSFMPRTDTDPTRWARIKTVAEGLTGLPPIDVYQIGKAYFVKDGNHRVSVARQTGAESIQAYVTKVRTGVQLDPDVQPDELIIKEEYAEFLENTGLKGPRPQADLVLTAPGKYQILEAHIQAHKQSLEERSGDEIAISEAAADWFDNQYSPVLQSIRARGLLHEFPDRTETDLYLCVSEHTAALETRFGQEIPPGGAAEDLATRFSLRPGRIFNRIKTRLLDVLTPDELESGPEPGVWRKQRVDDSASPRLFHQLLVPISGDEQGWRALDQAVVIANLEGSQIQGLHVVTQAAETESARTNQVRERFNERLAAEGVTGSIHVEVGKIARRICDRALWTDLIVLGLAHPPSPEPVGRLSSGLSTLLRRCTRPVLTVPGRVTSLGSVLLAFDGSPKSFEALYVATYLAGCWQSPLVVLTVEEHGVDPRSLQEKAHSYLQNHQVNADFRLETGDVAQSILETAKIESVDMLVMGGFGASPLVEAFVGSTVEQLLRSYTLPTLICR